MSTIKDLHNVFIKEWERKVKEDNLEFIGTTLQNMLYAYLLGNKTNKKITSFNGDTCLDPYEMNYTNYIDLIPFIKDTIGLIISFEDKGCNMFHTVRDFIVYVLKESTIDDNSEHNFYATYFFKLKIAETLPKYAERFFTKLNERHIQKFTGKIEFLQSIINRGFSYSSERLSYFHAIGLKYDRFEFEKMIYPVIMEGRVAEFLLLTIFYRVLEILTENLDSNDDNIDIDFIKAELIKKLKTNNLEYDLTEIGIYSVSQLSKVFDKCLRLSIRYLPNEKDELKAIKTIEDVFDFVLYMLYTELGANG